MNRGKRDLLDPKKRPSYHTPQKYDVDGLRKLYAGTTNRP